jgi:hypothetical protein
MDIVVVSGSGDCELVIGKQETNAVVGAKSAAQKALDIDDSLGDAHLALARVIQLYDWDWPASSRNTGGLWH